MVDESGSVSAALMHLFYYQQGIFVDEAQPGSLLREVAAGVSVANPSSAQPPPWQHSAQALQEPPPESAATPWPQTLVSQVARAADGAGDGRDYGQPSGGSSAKVNALYERRAELKWCLETGSLRAQNEALESQVLKMQEDFIALQDEFKNMKESCGAKLESLSKALETQQAVTWAAEKRVICTEDLVRFHEEQRRLMAGHWKSQCQMKDERIRYLNLQLTEYTSDWSHSGAPRQTEASLSHELQCLQDRHGELRAHRARRGARLEGLGTRLAEARAEEQALREAEAEARAAACSSASSSQASRVPSEVAVASAGLRGQLRLLEEWREARELAAAAEGDLPWPHSCIWRDELDVRERQLEKITAQLDRTNNALHAAQAALAVQRARHEEMKSKHREAEVDFREGERQKARWQNHCLEFRRAEADLRRSLEARAPRAAGALSAAPAQAAGDSVLSSAIVASGGTALGHYLRGGVHPAGQPPQSGFLLEASRGGRHAGTGPPMQDRAAAVGRETRRLVTLQQHAEAQAADEAYGSGLSHAAEVARPFLTRPP
mmetsp:Transcript_86760/g.273773  ORF Transcript_86760/g.273773 Transcript_86760/m.273773 type:complete len:550 (+) Transcript_86760:172-1821(+)